MPRKKQPSNKPLESTTTEAQCKPVRVRKAVQSATPIEVPRVIPLEVLATEPPTKAAHKPPVIDPSASGLGANAYSDTTMQAWFSQPRIKKHETGPVSYTHLTLPTNREV